MITNRVKNLAVTNKLLVKTFFHLCLIFMLGSLYGLFLAYHEDPRWWALLPSFIAFFGYHEIRLKFQGGRLAKESDVEYAETRGMASLSYLLSSFILWFMDMATKQGDYFCTPMFISLTFLWLFWMVMGHPHEPEKE